VNSGIECLLGAVLLKWYRKMRERSSNSSFFLKFIFFLATLFVFEMLLSSLVSKETPPTNFFPYHGTDFTTKQASLDADTEKKNSGYSPKDNRKHAKKASNATAEDRVQQLLRKTKLGLYLDEETAKKLPKWLDVVELYGDDIKIEGLDTCKTFQDNIPYKERMAGPAGIFNTGTNLMFKILGGNCKLQQMNKIRWHVPWGKHSPVNFRLRHIAKKWGLPPKLQTNVLPIVTIKDPYSWMGSMCRHKYATNWPHGTQHCPNLVPNDFDRRLPSFHEQDGVIPVRVRYNKTHYTHHSSLAGLWNDWYAGYYDATFPRLIVRFEDMLFRPDEVAAIVCDCIGGELTENTKYVIESAKGEKGIHKASLGAIPALIRYGDASARIEGFSKEDLEYAKNTLNSTYMKLFSYSLPS